MKIITKKGAAIVADKMANNLKYILSAHGIKPKHAVILQFRNEMFRALGGKK